jgi:hypothetical protein
LDGFRNVVRIICTQGEEEEEEKRKEEEEKEGQLAKWANW